MITQLQMGFGFSGSESERDQTNARRRARYSWANKNPDKVRAIMRRWRRRNREQINAIARSYYWRNVGAVRAKHRARVRAWMRSLSPANRKQVAAKKREWYYKKVKRGPTAVNGNAAVTNLRLRSSRAWKALTHANLRTIGAVRRSLKDDELQQYRNCGPRTLAEIFKAVGFKP
jgi:AraC-like DNA-binding protein